MDEISNFKFWFANVILHQWTSFTLLSALCIAERCKCTGFWLVSADFALYRSGHWASPVHWTHWQQVHWPALTLDTASDECTLVHSLASACTGSATNQCDQCTGHSPLKYSPVHWFTHLHWSYQVVLTRTCTAMTSALKSVKLDFWCASQFEISQLARSACMQQLFTYIYCIIYVA